ncbi:MAG: hypothetical protein WBA45_00765 [Microthrixaceae bacterium]
MNTRRSITLLVLMASFALFAGACSSDGDSTSKKSDKNTTSTTETKKGDEPSDQTSTTEQTTTTVDDETFKTELGKVNTAIDNAGTDACALVEALNSNPPMPGNTAQSEQLVGTYSKLLRSVASALPASSTDNIKALNGAADEVAKVAESKKFAPDVFTSQEFGTVMSSEDVTKALAEFSGIAQKCTPTTTEATKTEG